MSGKQGGLKQTLQYMIGITYAKHQVASVKLTGGLEIRLREKAVPRGQVIYVQCGRSKVRPSISECLAVAAALPASQQVGQWADLDNGDMLYRRGEFILSGE